MAFTSTILGETHAGGMRMAWGTWTTDTTSGTITTGLQTIESCTLCPNSAAVVADQCVAYSTQFPIATGSLPIRITSGVDGYWFAKGQ